jgi:adenylosuccinate lyase
LSQAELQRVLDQGRANSGDAGAQVDYFAEQVEALAQAKPEAAGYTPGAIL